MVEGGHSWEDMEEGSEQWAAMAWAWAALEEGTRTLAAILGVEAAAAVDLMAAACTRPGSRRRRSPSKERSS